MRANFSIQHLSSTTDLKKSDIFFVIIARFRLNTYLLDVYKINNTVLPQLVCPRTIKLTERAY